MSSLVSLVLFSHIGEPIIDVMPLPIVMTLPHENINKGADGETFVSEDTEVPFFMINTKRVPFFIVNSLLL